MRFSGPVFERTNVLSRSPYLQVCVVDHGQAVGVQVERVEVLEVGEGVRADLADGVAREREVDEAAHVGEVAVAQRGDEVVHEAELGGAAVDVGRHEEQARLGTEHRVGGQKVLARATLGA